MSYLLRVTTAEIDGVTGPCKIAVTLSDGTHNVVDYPAYESGIGAHEYAIAKTITAETFGKIDSVFKVAETERGYLFTIFLND